MKAINHNSADIERHLHFVARDGAQILINSLCLLPTQSSMDGLLATLPPSTIQLPRAKPRKRHFEM